MQRAVEICKCSEGQVPSNSDKRQALNDHFCFGMERQELKLQYYIETAVW